MPLLTELGMNRSAKLQIFRASGALLCAFCLLPFCPLPSLVTRCVTRSSLFKRSATALGGAVALTSGCSRHGNEIVLRLRGARFNEHAVLNAGLERGGGGSFDAWLHAADVRTVSEFLDGNRI